MEVETEGSGQVWLAQHLAFWHEDSGHSAFFLCAHPLCLFLSCQCFTASDTIFSPPTHSSRSSAYSQNVWLLQVSIQTVWVVLPDMFLLYIFCPFQLSLYTCHPAQAPLTEQLWKGPVNLQIGISKSRERRFEKYKFWILMMKLGIWLCVHNGTQVQGAKTTGTPWHWGHGWRAVVMLNWPVGRWDQSWVVS